MATPTRSEWRGFKGIKEAPDSREYDETDGGESLVFRFNGPYDALMAGKPTRGAKMAGAPDGLLVTRVNIRRGAGTMGKMVVTCSRESNGTTGGSDDTFDPVYELDWIEEHGPLIAHPIWGDGGSKALAEDDRAFIAVWEALGRPPLAMFDYIPSEVVNGRVYIAKVLAGIETAQLWKPVARVTELARKKTPTSSAVGTKVSAESIPVSGLPAGFLWVMTADRSTKTGRFGRWQRTREWSGFKKLDPDLFP